MNNLRYLVIEYWPHMMHGHKIIPCRLDGHYDSFSAAEGVAALWAEAPKDEVTRIAVVEILHVAKNPPKWIEP